MKDKTDFFKMYRSIENWEWYKDTNTKSLFFHLILKANWKDSRFMGYEIPRGSLVTSLESLSSQTGLSVRNIRTSLKKLKETGEILIKTTNKFTMINVVNYKVFQDENSKSDKQLTNKRQTTDKQLTTIEEYKNNKNINIINNINNKEQQYFTDEKLNSTFNEYLNLRNKMKMQNTERAIQLLINKLEPYDDGIKILMLENAIVNNWKSVYPLKENTIDTLKRLIEDEERRNNENDNCSTTNFSELPF